VESELEKDVLMELPKSEHTAPPVRVQFLLVKVRLKKEGLESGKVRRLEYCN